MTDTTITTAMTVKTNEAFLSSLTTGLTLTAEPTDLEFKLRALFTPSETKEQFPIDARELHDFLGVGKDFSTWFKDNSKKYGFVEETDYISRSPNLGSAKNEGGFNKIDYKITIDMAKELSMVQRTDLGKLVRRYLIWAESQLHKVIEEPKILSPTEMFALAASALKDHEAKIAQNTADIAQIKKVLQHPLSDLNIRLAVDHKTINSHEERITKIENIGEDQGPVEEIHVIIKQAAERTGCHDYQAIWNEFYRALRDNYGLDLNRRLTILKRRRTEQGWAKSKVNKLNRLDVITANPDIWQPVRAALQTIRTTWREEDERKAAEKQ